MAAKVIASWRASAFRLPVTYGTRTSGWATSDLVKGSHDHVMGDVELVSAPNQADNTALAGDLFMAISAIEMAGGTHWTLIQFCQRPNWRALLSSIRHLQLPSCVSTGQLHGQPLDDHGPRCDIPCKWKQCWPCSGCFHPWPWSWVHAVHWLGAAEGGHTSHLKPA